MSEETDEKKITRDDVLEAMRKQFSDQRKSWTDKIKTCAGAMKNIDKLTEVQIDLFSHRAVITDNNHEVLHLISKEHKKLRGKKAKSFEHYTTGYDVKLIKGEKDIMVEGVLKDTLEIVEVLSNQIKFWDQTIKTIDHMLYGIKSRIELEEFRRK